MVSPQEEPADPDQKPEIPSHFFTHLSHKLSE